MSLAARLTSHWGVLPPMVVDLAGAGARADPLGQLGGRGRAGPGHDVHHRQAVDAVAEAGGAGQCLLAGPGHQVDRRDQLGRARWTGPTPPPPGCARGRGRRWSSGRWVRGAVSGHRGASYHRPPTDAAPAGRVPGAQQPPDRPPSRAAPAPAHGEHRKVVTLSSNGTTTDGPSPTAAGLPDGFLFGVATAGFQIEGGYNGPGQPANNWLGLGAGRPGGALGERRRLLGAARGVAGPGRRPGLQQLPPGCRVGPGRSPTAGSDRSALARYAGHRARVASTAGSSRLVTLHHFTHPAWLGDDFWLRPDAPDRFRGWAEVAVEALAPWCADWVTINEINVLAIGSWLLGHVPARAARWPSGTRPSPWTIC